MFLLASMLGGSWFYFGGTSPQAPSQFGQPQSTRTSPLGGLANYFPAAQSTTAQPSPPAPTFVGGVPATPQPGGPAIRIASFNIQVFGDEKAKYAGIMQTLAAVVRNFHIVAIQEIRSQNAYLLDGFLRDYVNAGGGRYYDYVIGPRLGRSNSKEQYAYIYDAAAVEVNRQGIYTVNDPQDLLHREPLVALFRVRGPAPNEAFTFVLVNIHTDPDETAEELDTLADVYHAVRQAAGGEDDIIILGDLNVDDRHLGRLGKIPGVRPIVTRVFTNTRQNALYDNFVVHQPSTAEFTGRWGVFDVRHVTNPPLTLEQALDVSDHLPIWAEFSAYESAAPGRVATRPSARAAQQEQPAR
jgi:endonuclease/exonuclease/phosphatase family metal-dependent hydrolase